MRPFPLILLIAMLLLTARATYAQTPDPSDPLSDRVHDVAKQLNCPTCAGRNLADCPTDTCMQWKQEIKAQLQAGKSEQEVFDYFKARFGPTVLQEPPKEGAVLLLWILPVIGLMALAAGGIIVLRRVSAQRPAQVATISTAAPGVVDEYEERIEEEVRKA